MKEAASRLPPSAELAEFIGILLGDGSSYYNSKSRNWQVRIVGHSAELDYYTEHIVGLSEQLFQYTPRIRHHQKFNAVIIVLDRKEIGELLENAGFPPGNKLRRQATIPPWIKEKPEYLKACVRGLLDTDGSIHRMSRRDSNLLRISFTSCCPALMSDVRKALIGLGYNPSKVILNKSLTISRQKDVARYLNEIGFANEKHRLRLVQFSPIV